MFDFASHSKKKRAQAVLTNRVNQRCMDEVHAQNHRTVDRTPFVEALVVIPQKASRWEFTKAAPVLSRDISSNGLALLHTTAITGNVLVRIQGEGQDTLLSCKVCNCTHLGFGFYQIGILAEEIYSPSPEDAAALGDRLKTLEAREEIRSQASELQAAEDRPVTQWLANLLAPVQR